MAARTCGLHFDARWLEIGIMIIDIMIIGIMIICIIIGIMIICIMIGYA